MTKRDSPYIQTGKDVRVDDDVIRQTRLAGYTASMGNSSWTKIHTADQSANAPLSTSVCSGPKLMGTLKRLLSMLAMARASSSSLIDGGLGT